MFFLELAGAFLLGAISVPVAVGAFILYVSAKYDDVSRIING